MNELRAGLPALPWSMVDRPRDHRGFPVPYFCEMIDGEWNFQAVDPRKIRECFQKSLCWICGKGLYRNRAFVIGPMCAVTRTAPEPSQHVECARFAAMACPFLTRPKMRRMPTDENAGPPAGIMITRNPGVCLVWVTRSFTAFQAGTDGRGEPGILFRLGDPIRIEPFAEGREATLEEIREAFDTGVPILRAQAEEDERRGFKGSLAELDRLVVRGRRVLKLEGGA